MPIRSLTFSPDSQLLVTASDDGHIKIYDVYHWTWKTHPCTLIICLFLFTSLFFSFCLSSIFKCSFVILWFLLGTTGYCLFVKTFPCVFFLCLFVGLSSFIVCLTEHFVTLVTSCLKLTFFVCLLLSSFPFPCTCVPIVC